MEAIKTVKQNIEEDLKKIKKKNSKKNSRRKCQFTDFQREQQAILYKDYFLDIYDFFDGFLFQQQLVKFLSLVGIEKPKDTIEIWKMFNLITVKQYYGRNYIYIDTFTLKKIGKKRSRKMNITTKKLLKQAFYNEFKLLKMEEAKSNGKITNYKKS